MKLSQLCLRGRDRLLAGRAECADPLLHMRQLVELALGIDAARIYLRWDDELSVEEEERVERALAERLRGTPYQYLAGEAWFWESRFEVGPGVLIPRRETELLVETLLRREPRHDVRVAELGPGSGNIAISTLLERPDWRWEAFEANPETLPYLEKNRETLLGADLERLTVHSGDFFALAPALAPFDWLVSNPPYVPAEEWDTLSREVQREPRLALDGGKGGLKLLDRLVDLAQSLLAPEGGFLVEIDSRQAQDVASRLESRGFEGVEILQDWAGLDRAVLGRKGE